VFWALLAIAIVALARSVWLSCQRGELRERVGQLCADALLMGGFGLMAVRSVRNLEPFVLLAPPVLGYHLTLWRRPADERSGSGDRAFRWTFYALCIVLTLRHVCGPGFGLGVSEEKLPVRACNYLETAPLKGRLYNVYEWGGYLIWRFWPERKVFMDGRCDVYGDELIREAVAVARGDKGWEEILKRHSVEAVLIRWRSRDSRHFFRSGRWHCIHWDDTAMIAVCDEVRNAVPSGLQYFDLSNPAVFDERIEGSAPEAVLAEVDRVLARQPDCSTALAFRARCLLRIARKDPGAGQRLLEEALRVAKQAVTLGKMTPDPWRAMGECYQALGRHDDARRALLRAQSLEKRPE